MEQSGRLFSFVNKQIRKKHLIEGIRHTIIRQQSRSQKLKNYYEIPECTPDCIYLYSNVFGNQFIFRQSAMLHCVFERKHEVYSLIKNMHSAINEICYNLWSEQKQSKRTVYFPVNKRFISFSFAILILIFLFVSFLLPLLLQAKFQIFAEQSKDTVLKMTMFLMIILAVLCVLCLLTSLLSSYTKFDYDRLIIRALISELKKYQSRFFELNLKISCDKQLTWVQIVEKGSSHNIFQDVAEEYTEYSQPYPSANQEKSQP